MDCEDVFGLALPRRGGHRPPPGRGGRGRRDRAAFIARPLAAALLGLLLQGRAAAAAGCEQPASERLPDVRAEIGGRMFSIPPIFLRDKGFDEAARAGRLTTPGPDIDFSFWMPTRRGEAIRTEPPMSVDTIRSKGGCIAPGEYPVTVQNAQFIPPGSHGVLLPATILARRSVGEHPRSEPDMGLEKIVYGGGWNTNDNYFLDDRQNASIYMECYTEKTAENPLCIARVYFWKVQLSFKCVFPSRETAKWRDNIDAVEQLMTSWEVR